MHNIYFIIIFSIAGFRIIFYIISNGMINLYFVTLGYSKGWEVPEQYTVWPGELIQQYCQVSYQPEYSVQRWLHPSFWRTGHQAYCLTQSIQYWISWNCHESLCQQVQVPGYTGSTESWWFSKEIEGLKLHYPEINIFI